MVMSAFDRFMDSQFAKYDPGKTLTLYPHKVVEPYGLEHYDNPPKLAVPEGHLRDFDPKAHSPKTRGSVEVIELLSGGIGGGAQVLLCKVSEQPAEYRPSHAPFPEPQRYVVAKIFDPMFFPGDNGVLSALAGNDVLAEQLLSRESGAYEYLYDRGKPKAPPSDSKGKGKKQETRNTITGHPNLIPQYYGTWAIRFGMGKGKYREAGLVLMEYIEGHAIEELCYREEDDGYLLPVTEEVIFHDFAGLAGTIQPRKVKLTEPFRLKAFREILHHLVVHMHLGVEHADFIPANVIITLRNHGGVTGVRELDEPRPVLLDLTLTKVWRKTKYAQGPGMGRHCLEWLPNPPHPMERASPQGMELYIGWFDAEWSKERFEEWLVQEFGPLEEGSEEGSTGKYSTFATLDKLEADYFKKKDEKAKEKMRAEQDEAVRVMASASHKASDERDGGPASSAKEESTAQQDKAVRVMASASHKASDERDDGPASSATLSIRPSPRANWRAQDSQSRANPPSTSRRQQNRSDESTSTESGEEGIPRSLYRKLQEAKLAASESSFGSSPSPRSTPRSAQKPVENEEEMDTIEEE
ncbi:uncharacterized protein CCOS01_15315 [Colletotrichum costaricense]|uniref:Protein kinase domain-containing protein n=1 Tax=Colletotrichum costaricense TaxID=1209916 RepID=A0AAI9YHP0_9PEZI|nr:uncharacterized protein CCOS01_15315 [Colletotrichum costaricense]KAK1510484.1 hypothetical protein CCOS01_15315 [Colletotrichum costaricense]